MAHGGKRAGAGRPKGKGPYGEPTVAVRIPASKVHEVKRFAAGSGYKIPLYSHPVQAGALSHAESDVEDLVDLSQRLIRNPSTSFLVRAAGESMIDAGIQEGDLLIVDTAMRPSNGKIVIASIEDEFTVKYLRKQDDELWLVPANKDFHPIKVDKKKGVAILGVVTSSIHIH